MSRTGSAGSSLTGDTSLKVDAASFSNKLRAPRGEESYILFPRHMQLITKPYHSSERTPSSGQPTDNVSNAFPKTSEIIVQEKLPHFCRLSILFSAIATGKIQQRTDELEMHTNCISSRPLPSTVGGDVS